MELRISRNLEITVLMDNFSDGLLPSTPEVSRHGLVRDGRLSPPLIAEHGLSYLIAWEADRSHQILLDFGLSAAGVRQNLETLGLDLSGVEAVVLSHGHFDHYGGLAALAPLLPSGIPLYAGVDVFRHRYLKLGEQLADGGQLRKDSLGALAPRLVRQPQEILPGALLSGEIPRLTEFEKGAPNLLVEEDGEIQQDNFVGEQALGFRTGEGLVVISACAHAGIVNTVRHFQELTGEKRIRGVIGGFHLSGAPEGKIRATVAALAELDAKRLVPMHCTGVVAQRELAERMPEITGVNAVGSRWRF